ncbi:protein stunted-like isoform X1 [Octopus vulgaris]|uniref:Protein stunted-like isoform X1 n=1 Tax=Octopus vulgaris TaxID=6645 RepID=A0AA36BRM5_OCTVU|nr:protein stunted-like isoform X1 [Octopus vulgaris]
MSTFWRQAGLNYVQFSSICAKVVRSCLQPAPRAAAEKQSQAFVKATRWEGGKPVKVAAEKS